MIDFLKHQPWDAVLSISGSLDAVSAISPNIFSQLPNNISINNLCGNFSIVAQSCLYIGQGGQSGVLEAVFCGVPQIAIPPTPLHYSVARRVQELGLGLCIPISELSKDSLLHGVTTALEDGVMLQRVTEAANEMRQWRGAQMAADLIEDHILLRS